MVVLGKCITLWGEHCGVSIVGEHCGVSIVG